MSCFDIIGRFRFTIQKMKPELRLPAVLLTAFLLAIALRKSLLNYSSYFFYSDLNNTLNRLILPVRYLNRRCWPKISI